MRRLIALISVLYIAGLVFNPQACKAQAQTQFIAIDMFNTDLGAQAANRAAPQLIGNSPLILFKGAVGGTFVRAMTLDANTGVPLGATVDIEFAPGPCVPTNPCAVLYSEYFLPGAVFVLSDDGWLGAFPLSIDTDGTPVAGNIVCHSPDPIMPSLGPACAMTELPGSAFGDGKPRLFIGTESGNIAMFLLPSPSGPSLEGVIDLLAGEPITALGPIPQASGPLLGAAHSHEIVGIINPEITPAIQFGIINPDIRPIVDFVAQRTGRVTAPTYIAFCDGVETRIPRTSIPADAAGSSTMVLIPPDPVIPGILSPIVALAAGSMLMLTADGQGVYYDPGYDEALGSSNCIADVNDPEPAVCVECPIVISGDVNESGTLTSADIISLVGFVFKSGPPPEPCAANGDVNCSGVVNSSDIIYLVNHVFKGGLPPCDLCEVWLDLWVCE